ncbi:hypothetical protein LTS18_014107, partial [Coniosporium uncinatum]
MNDSEPDVIGVRKRRRNNARNEDTQDDRNEEAERIVQDADEEDDDAVPVAPRRSPRAHTSTAAGSVPINAGRRPSNIRPREPAQATAEGHNQTEKKSEQDIRESKERASRSAAPQRVSPKRKSAATAKQATSQERVKTGSVTLRKRNHLGNLNIVAASSGTTKRAIADATGNDNDGIQHLKSTRLPLSVQAAVADQNVSKLNLILQRKSPAWCERRLRTLTELRFFQAGTRVLDYDDLGTFIQQKEQRKWCNARCKKGWYEVDSGVGWRCGNMKCLRKWFHPSCEKEKVDLEGQPHIDRKGMRENWWLC